MLAAFPWGFVAERGAAPLSRAMGRTVRIGSAERVDHLSFWPTVRLHDIAIGQPAWAGRGQMARIDRATVTFAALPLLIGRFKPLAIDLAGARAALLRDAVGRENWHDGKGGGGRGGGLDRLTITDARFHLDDVPRHITLNAAVSLDAIRGLRIDGRGTHRGQPLTVAASGTPIRSGQPQHVRLSVASPLASLSGNVRLDRPVDLSAFSAAVTASGADLTFLDDVLQAGLFPTRPFRLSGAVRRDGDRWRLERVNGSIGRSRLSSTLAIARNDGRTRIDGTVAAATLDPTDFSSAAQRARGAAAARHVGPRVIPITPIRLDPLTRIDGAIRLDAAQLLSSGPSTFRSLHTTLTLDHRRLVAAPLRVGLTSGVLTGRATIDHRAATPRLAIDLRLSGGRIERLFMPRGEVAGPLSARIRLSGSGDTARAAMARANGRVGFAMTGGDMRRDYAVFAGGDVLKSVGQLIGGGEGRRAPVRCLVGDFSARSGFLRPRPLILDSDMLRADGTGRITLADEAIDLSLSGRAHRPGLLQSTAPVRLFGTLSMPQVDVRPPRAERPGKGGMFSRLGFLIKGLKTRGNTGRATPPPPADCAGLARAALN